MAIKDPVKEFKSFGDKVVKEVSTSKPDGILTYLFRKIITETGYSRILMSLINKYVKRGGKRAKSSIVSAIQDSRMTWNYFIFLLFEILQVKKMKIKIELELRNGEVSEHEVEVEYKEPIDNDDNEDEDDGKSKEKKDGNTKKEKTNNRSSK